MAVQRLAVDITYRTLIRIVVVAAVVAALFLLRQLVITVLFAVVVAAAIEPAVRWFRKWRVPRIIAVILIYVIILGVLIGLISVFVPALVEEFRAFLDSFPRYQRILLEELRSFQNVPFYSLFSTDAESIILNPPFDVQSAGQTTFDIIFSLFGGLASAVILLVISFYLATQEDGIERFLKIVTPLAQEEYAIDLWNRSQRKMGQWLRGQLLLGALVGLAVYVMLMIVGIRYALILAILAAILELIPIIGPILAAAPAVFFGFLESPGTALLVALFYTIIQQAESHLLVPLVMRRTVGLNPLVVVIALLVGARLGGILGLFLAVPTASVLIEFLTDMEERKRRTA